MSKIKKLVLGLGAILTIAVASVIGFACFAPKTSISGEVTNNGIGEVVDNLEDKESGRGSDLNLVKTRKPKQYNYVSEEVSIQGGKGNINFEYIPDDNQASTSVAYQYRFNNSMKVDMAVNLKSIDTTGVSISFAYSDSKLTSIDQTSYPFKCQRISPNATKYIYIVVTPTSTSIPSTFSSSVVFYQGMANEIVLVSEGTEVEKQTMVRGQPIEELVEPEAPDGYYFDAWFTDREYKTLLTTETRVNTNKIYARFANLPSDWLALKEDGTTYRVDTGTSTLPSELVLPNIYNGCKVTTIGYMAFYQYRTNDFSITIPNTITIFDSSEIDDGYCLSNCNLVGVKVDKGNPVYDSRDNCNAVIETATNTMIYGSINTTIPNTVKALRANVFHGIYITSVYIPASVVSVEFFAYGVSINTIVVDSNNPVYDSRDNCNAVIETSSNTLIAGCKTTVIPETIETIGDSAFFSHYNRTVVIPNSVKKIGAVAFAYCELLDYITIGESVEEIGADAFIGTDVYTVYNLSSLPITAGSDEYGGIAKYATYVYTSLPQ